MQLLFIARGIYSGNATNTRGAGSCLVCFASLMTRAQARLVASHVRLFPRTPLLSRWLLRRRTSISGRPVEVVVDFNRVGGVFLYGELAANGNR